MKTFANGFFEEETELVDCCEACTKNPDLYCGIYHTYSYLSCQHCGAGVFTKLEDPWQHEKLAELWNSEPHHKDVYKAIRKHIN